MKKIFLLLLVSFNLLLAQNQQDISLNWIGLTPDVLNEQGFIYPQTSEKNISFNSDNGEVTAYFRKKIDNDFDSNSVTITNSVFESINFSDLGSIDVSKISYNINFKVDAIKARNEYFLSAKFNPIIKTNDGYKKVISISFTYNNVSLSNRNSFQTQAIQNSVLANGAWYRFYIQKSGVYKLSKSFLKDLGFDVNVDPRSIKIFGNGGSMLPLANNKPYQDDLTENAINFIGEEDGVFNDQDFILFYAQGVDLFNKESVTHVNQFTDKAYFYVTAGSGNGKRISVLTQPTAASNLSLNTYDGYVYYEVDKFNPGKIGRRWFGDNFDIVNEKTFDFTLPNYIPNTAVQINSNFASVSFGSTNFNINVNNQSLGTISFNSIQTFGGVLGYENFFNSNFTPTSAAVSVKLKYNNGGVPSSKGFLDYLILKYKANLQGNGTQFIFTNNSIQSNTGVGAFTVSNANNINEIWDVTDRFNIQKVNNNQNSLTFKFNLGQEKTFIALDFNNLYSPSKDSNTRIGNQNLKGSVFKNAQGNFQDIDYLIITPNFLYNNAETLANFHRIYSGLNTKVVTLESIYMEFSSGQQDIAAIRNFVKYVYQNASTPEKRVKFLNLFGDASYDFKDRIKNNTNIVPIFHGFNPSNTNFSNNSSNFSLLRSFMSDDFFVLMDDNEGTMPDGFSDGLDIAVGRMVVSNPEQAAEMVNKVIDYHDEKSYGRWRNTLLYYADDPNRSIPSDALLQRDLNTLADQVTLNNPSTNAKKVYIDSYIQEVSAGGSRYPEAKKAFIDALQLGALVANYYGHGNEESFAVERIFEKADAQTLSNKYRYPLFITITCEFTRFDDPARPTGGEYMYWNNEGGAIALLATTRQIFQSTGIVLNKEIYNYLFRTTNNEYDSVAEVLRKSKNIIGDDNRRVVFYIGDPALKLAIPKPKVILTKINDQPIATSTDVLQALALVKLSGEVVDVNGNRINNYNGDVAVQIFDKNLNRNTLNNDNVPPAQGVLNFNSLGETIFRGNATVTNGLFEFSFVVPQDIKIPVGNGRVSFYSKTKQPFLQDQTGYNNNLKIGGVNLNAVADNTPPKVKLYMNDTNFVNGGITNKSPILLAFLEDENGMNTASGIGHDILAILDGNETNPFVLNDYYETENNDYTKGKVKYPFRNLSIGKHKILFKAWDVYNNLITAEIEFVVLGEEEVALNQVLNYPNPFVDYTQFWFNHNKPFEPLEVQIDIFTVSGKMVKTIKQTVVTEGFLSKEITWDGKDDFGDKIGKGVYVYKLTVRSTVTGKKSEKIEKLVIL